MSFNTIKVNNTDTNYTHSIFDISDYNSGATYNDLSAALTAIPENKLHGGMSIKFIQQVSPARYSVVKTENLETEPTGTLLSEAPYIDSSTYDESQLSTIFSTLPSDTGAENALTYYIAVVVDETMTYTSWVVTKVQNSDNKYKRFNLIADSFTIDITKWYSADSYPTVNAVNNSLIPIKGKVSIIGDSISSFEGTIPSGYAAYYPNSELGVTSLYDMWWELILSLTNSQLEINASDRGSGATNNFTDKPSFYERTSLLGSPDYIYVALGTNDSYTPSVSLGNYDYDSPISELSESDFIPAYTKGIKSLLSNYPNAKIVLFIFKMADGFASAIKNIGKHYNLNIIDVRSYYTNNVHPDKKGMAQVAQDIVSFYVKGKTDDVPTANSENIVLSGGVFDYISIDNNLLSSYEYNARIINDGNWQVQSNNKCYIIPTKILDRVLVNRKAGVGGANYAFIESLPQNGQAVDFYGSTGLIDIAGPNKNIEIEVNKSAKYFYVVLEIVGTYTLNNCLFNRFAYEYQTDTLINEMQPKVNLLYSSAGNYMKDEFSGLLSHFKVSNPDKQYYLRKFTASTLTIGYIDGNNTYASVDISYTLGVISKAFANGDYFEVVVASTEGLTPETSSVTDITAARKRIISCDVFNSHGSRLNNASFIDILIDNLYIDKPIQNGVLFVRHLRLGSSNNYINLGIYKDGSLLAYTDVYLNKKSQTVSIGVWNIYLSFSDIALSGYFGTMSDYMSISNSVTYFKADVITNKANFNALYEAAQKSSVDPMFSYEDNMTGTEMMQRMLNSRLFEKQMVDNVICEFEGGSDSTSCYYGDYFYTVTVEGTTNDVFWGTGCKTVLYINSKSDGSLVSKTIIAEENKQVTIGGSTITMQRGASMPNLVITNDGLCVLFCTMVNNVFVLMRCLVDLSDNTIISYSICTINGEQLNTTQIKNLGGVYSDMTREFSININGNFRDAKDDNGYWYVGVTGAYALKYPMIMKTNDFEAFTFVTFITADSMNAAYECSTGFYKQPSLIGGVANTPYLYTATRQSELSKGGNSFIMVNVINLSTNKVEQTRMISGVDSRPCIFAHRNGHLILAYSLPGYRMRARLVWLTRVDTQSIIQDGTFETCGYFNFFKDNDAPQYYCVVALRNPNLPTSQYLTRCQINEYTLDAARDIIDNLI